MRKVTFGGANSLDNYFARKDGGMDWLMWSDEAMELMNDFWPKVDTIVMGRKTYEVAIGGQVSDEGVKGSGGEGRIRMGILKRTCFRGRCRRGRRPAGPRL